MSKVDELRAMRERNYEAQYGPQSQEGTVAKKKDAAKKTAKKTTAKAPATKKKAATGDSRPGWINVGVKRPVTVRSADAILKAAGDAMLRGATLEQVTGALGALSPQGGAAPAE